MGGGGGGAWGSMVGNWCPRAKINIAVLTTKLSFPSGESVSECVRG